ncbi:divalent-cation tolerance protein CutA [Sphingomonas sp. IC-56]|uniref:divalent-cation tolerance protein CutA n=1 Tax=Sphingomonas sp. IC-56 TaxID=2898529 RepID=UPI001E387565|nr:divalent-cation tolerance protein CutA [Sphingomonas sp. IC-56]MCD2322732.1 divalent-cation tolerance protein CutA [Sphingomonas sp. IC-56]
MSDIALVHAIFADSAEVERVVEAAITERLAACANILAPCVSVYRWQGEVERAEEVPVLFKTTPELVGQLRARIAELHSYDLPVIEAWPVAAGSAVFKWVHDATG